MCKRHKITKLDRELESQSKVSVTPASHLRKQELANYCWHSKLFDADNVTSRFAAIRRALRTAMREQDGQQQRLQHHSKQPKHGILTGPYYYNARAYHTPG